MFQKAPYLALGGDNVQRIRVIVLVWVRVTHQYILCVCVCVCKLLNLADVYAQWIGNRSKTFNPCNVHDMAIVQLLYPPIGMLITDTYINRPFMYCIVPQSKPG